MVITTALTGTDIPLELCLLQTELTKLFHAWRQNRPDIGEELADVAACAVSCRSAA